MSKEVYGGNTSTCPSDKLVFAIKLFAKKIKSDAE